MEVITIGELVKRLQRCDPDEVVGSWIVFREDLQEWVEEYGYTMELFSFVVFQEFLKRVASSEYVWEQVTQNMTEELDNLLDTYNTMADQDEDLWKG